MVKIAMAFVLLNLAVSHSSAHAGKLDANGCHQNRKIGEYHCHTPESASYVGVTTVIDGDTIDIHGQRFRLFGIDAPESKQLCYDSARKTYRCGQVAANTLSNLIGRQTVTCEQKDIDRYKRIVAVCSVNGQDVGAYLVGKGLAVAYVQYSTAYVPVEEEARAGGFGLWAGAFEMPWDWRKAH